jgi:hypothetical protein
MKNFFISGFLIISVMILLNSCEFQLKDDYYNNIQAKDSASIVIYLDPSDSIYILTGTTVFNYQALTKGVSLVNVSIYVDNRIISDGYKPNGSFELDCMRYSDGEHVLSVVVTTNSGSGSIADLLGAEGFISSNSWKFIVNNAPPTPIKITNIYNDDGLLKIEWEKYSEINFDQYEIFKWDNGSSNSLGIIKDRNLNFIYDPTFIGGTSQYYVRVTSPGGLITNGVKKAFTDNLPGISARWIKDNQVELSWEKCKYSKAFSYYRVLTDEDWAWQKITNIDSTKIIGDFGVFGKRMKFELEVISNYINDISIISSSAELGIGNPSVDFTHLYKNQVNNDVLMTSSFYIYRYRFSTNQYLDSLYFPQQNPGYIYSPADDILLQIEPFAKIDPVNFEITTPINDVYFASTNLSLSSYGLAAVSGGLVVYDFKNMQIVKTLSLISNNILKISADNKFIFEGSFNNTLKCYNIENGDINYTWDNFSIGYLLIPGSPDKIMILTPSLDIEIRNIATNQLIKTFKVNTSEMLDIDTVNKLVMLRSGNGVDYTLEVYNYETGQKIKSLKATNFWPSIINGVIYSGGWALSTL